MFCSKIRNKILTQIHHVWGALPQTKHISFVNRVCAQSLRFPFIINAAASSLCSFVPTFNEACINTVLLVAMLSGNVYQWNREHTQTPDNNAHVCVPHYLHVVFGLCENNRLLATRILVGLQCISGWQPKKIELVLMVYGLKTCQQAGFWPIFFFLYHY